MKINVHKTNERGNIITLRERLKIKFAGLEFVVPVGFESDGFSAPRFLWSTISPAIDQRSLRAAIAHDYIYRHQPPGWTRAMADLMFLCYLLEDGLGIRRALKAYIGVSLCGWIAWNKNKKMIQQESNI